MFGKKKSIHPKAGRQPEPSQRQPVRSAMSPSANLQASVLEKNGIGQKRVLPVPVFKSDRGAILKQLGLSADSPSNLIPSFRDNQARLNDLQAQERNFIAKINSQLPQSAQVTPFAMIPIQCWTKGPHANLLYNYLELYPHGPWNLLPMPKNDGGAFVLSMTKCPQGVSDAQINSCNSALDQIFQKLISKVAGVRQAAEAGNMSAYSEMPKIKSEAETAIMTLAFVTGKAIMGPESFVKCRSMFFGDGDRAKLV